MPPGKYARNATSIKKISMRRRATKRTMERYASDETDKDSFSLRLSGRWWHPGLGGLTVQHLPCFWSTAFGGIAQKVCSKL